MQNDSKTSSIFDEEDVNEFMVPEKRTGKIWKVGFAVLAMGAVAMAVFNRADAFLVGHTRTPMEHISMMQDKVMKAFSARALADAPDFKTTMEVWFKEIGSDDPSAMSVKARMKHIKGDPKWPRLVKTFAAQPGKQSELVAKLKDVWQGFLDLQCKHPRGNKNQCEDMKTSTTIEAASEDANFGKGEFVQFQMKFHKGPDDNQKELKQAFNDYDPRFHAEMYFGRTIEDMYKDLDSNVAVLPNGIGAKIGAEFASTIFSAVGNEIGAGMKKQLKIASGIAQVKERVVVSYKKGGDLGDAFDSIPTLGKEVHAFEKALKKGHVLPPTVTDPMNGLEKVCAGIKGVALEGLPMNLEVVAEFVNFHPFPVISSMLSDA